MQRSRLASLSMLLAYCVAAEGLMADSVKYIPLPAPSAGGDRSLEQLLEQRRSVRDFIAAPLSLPPGQKTPTY
jgi:hypothetical protein